ncbi:efflux RND transporter periplasmic adaptor subunit [Salegentibacter echinorum]|uniref:efflux RND transporter periplasmic adaptor subunit n=1 Tax=Salegentibacter echinorum TaxID=1073325 RepID=UPI0009322416|nr:efflux RND transporter periplasmic adaptor subunit [Salegentibacter echinorum]
MKIRNIIFFSIIIAFVSCKDKQEPQANSKAQKEAPETAQVEEAMLSQQQFEALDMKIDTLQHKLMSGFVAANGQLEVPPQSEASITPVIGGNVKNIKVIEGEKVKKGAVLAYISHPEIIKIQTDYMNASNQLKFQEKDFSRQQKLYEGGVGSGESFQRAEADLDMIKGRLAGLEAQLRQLHINPKSVKNGNIQQQIPILSPINGAIQAVNVKTGQFVQAQTNMFEVINTEHVHVDLMVFEKDVAKVKEEQKVYFTVESMPGKELTAEILSISKNFEQDPKALHVHAEIDNLPENLVPGMFVRAKIAVADSRSIALPEAAITKDGDQFFTFSAEEEGDAWSFKPIEVVPGIQEGEWIAIKLVDEVAPGTRFVYNNAYYLMAEMQKGEGGHSH